MSSKRGGFTLVEILIVVVILGILAAIVIPQFTNASESAKVSSLISQLQTIRSQLELFQVQHNGNYPTLDDTWAIMTSTSTAMETGPGAGTAGSKYGPYLQQPPINPFTETAAIGNTNADGWDYTAASGQIKAIFVGTNQEATDLGLDTTNDVTVVAAP
jgi:general secretion pathway protein G